MIPQEWGQMHHAYLVLDEHLDEFVELLNDVLQFRTVGNPDSLILDAETFGIDEARKLADWAIKKPFGERKAAIIRAHIFTHEAQNALLKLFEEPPRETYFFLLLDKLGGIAGTLLSRVHVVTAGAKSVEHSTLGQEFTDSSVNGRFKIINSIIKNKDREEAKKLIKDIALYLEMKRNNSEELNTILEAEKHISARASSIKMILERLAIMLGKSAK